MAFTRGGAPTHASLSDVTAAQHHAATEADDLDLADLNEKNHASLASVTAAQHRARSSTAALAAETDEDTSASPDRIRYGPSAGKGWCSWDADGTIQSPDYNVSTITDSGTGDRIINWDDNQASAIYSVALSSSSGSAASHPIFNNRATGSCQVLHFGTNHATPEDVPGCIMMFGVY